MDESIVIDQSQIYSSSKETVGDHLVQDDGADKSLAYFENRSGFENGTSTDSDDSPDAAGVLFLSGLFLFILLFLLLKLWLCDERTSHQKRRLREARKQQIKKQVIVKKVMEKNKVDQIGSEGCNAHDDTGCSIEGDQPPAPPGELFPSARGEESNQQKEKPSLHRQKTDLEISHHELDDNQENNEMKCQVCLADFKAGDTICWSNNPDCVHVFHISCLRPWLMNHDECPLCRCPYLVPPKDPPEQFGHVAASRGETTTRQSTVQQIVQLFPRSRLPAHHMKNVRRRQELERSRHSSSQTETVFGTQGSTAPRITGDKVLRRDDSNENETPGAAPLEERVCADTSCDRCRELDMERGVDCSFPRR